MAALTDSQDLRVPIYEFPRALQQHTETPLAALIGSALHENGRILALQVFSAKAMERLRESVLEHRGTGPVCIHLDAGQAALFDSEARLLGTAKLSVESEPATKKVLVPTQDEIQIGTVLKINGHRFVVVRRTMIRNEFPQLTLAALSGKAEPGVVTTEPRFVFTYDGKFQMLQEQISRLQRDGEVEFEVLPDGKVRIIGWRVESANEKILMPSRMTYSDFQRR